MKRMIFALLTLALAAPIVAHAGDQMALAKEKQCLSCHTVDADLVGPSFKNIAHRFKGLKNAQWMLEDAVLQGSANTPIHWGDTKMPASGARTPITRYEATLLVQWILSLE